LKSFLKVKETYLQGREVVLNKGDLVIFWLDSWLNGYKLCENTLTYSVFAWLRRLCSILAFLLKDAYLNVMV
jgi:hypothetical protein